MTEILSRQELNALLAESGASRGAGTQPSEAMPFSFAGPVPFSSETLSRLTGAGERFAGLLKVRLGAELRREVGVSLARIEVVTGQDVDRLLSGGTRLRFDSQGRSVAELVLDQETAMALVEARLGGSIGEAQPKRSLTPIETALMAKLMKVCGAPALEAVFPLADGESSRAESRGAGARAESSAQRPALDCRPADSEPALTGGVASVMVQVSVDGRGGMAALLLPASRAAECGSPETRPRAAGGRPIPLSTLLALPVRAVPRIPGGAISLGDLMALRPGAVVRLDQKADEPIEVLCNNVCALHGRLIRDGSVTSLEVAMWTDDEATNEGRP